MYEIYEKKINQSFAGPGLETIIVDNGIIKAHTRGWDDATVVDHNWSGPLVGKQANQRGPGWRKLTGLELENAQAWAEGL